MVSDSWSTELWSKWRHAEAVSGWEVVHAGCQIPRHLPGGLLVPSPLSPLDFLGVRPLPSFLEARPFLGVLEDQRAPYLLVFLEGPIEMSMVLLRGINRKRRREGDQISLVVKGLGSLLLDES